MLPLTFERFIKKSFIKVISSSIYIYLLSNTIWMIIIIIIYIMTILMIVIVAVVIVWRGAIWTWRSATIVCAMVSHIRNIIQIGSCRI